MLGLRQLGGILGGFRGGGGVSEFFWVSRIKALRRLGELGSWARREMKGIGLKLFWGVGQLKMIVWVR